MSLVKSPLDRAHKFIPNGCQTLSKRHEVYVDGVYPKFLVSGHGCEVVDEYGKTYVDYIASLGAILLGYNHPSVDDAVKETINAGQVILSLPHPKEGELAEKICDMLGVDKCKFFKTGSEATSAAVRLARAYTGKDTVLMCGYNGWHDWAAVTYDRNAGIPRQQTKKFAYGDIAQVAKLLAEGNVAAIILQPVLYEAPPDGFMSHLQRLARQHGALIIADEVVTGLRFGFSGASPMVGLKPDLICMGKALGNGYPISVLAGSDEFMSVFERSDFIASGTFSGDLVGISAALAVLEQATPRTIWESGSLLKTGFNNIVNTFGLSGVECIGYAPRTKFVFPNDTYKALFWQECVKRGVLFGYDNYATQSHGKAVVNNTLGVCYDALKVLRDNWLDPASKMEGKLPISAVTR